MLLALTTVCFALAMTHRAPCMEEHWSGNARYAAMCYSDIPYLYTWRGFAEQQWPYVESRYEGMEYPPVIAYTAWVVSKAVALNPQGPPAHLRTSTEIGSLWGLDAMTQEVNQYFVLTSLVLVLAALASTWLLARVHPGRPWDAAGFAASPMLMLTALINWDLLAIVFIAGALWAWQRLSGHTRAVVTGLFIGLGTATKLYPLFLLGGILVICLHRRRLLEFAVTIGAAVAAWCLAQVPAWFGDWDRWTLFWTFNADRGADLGSVWMVLQQAGYTFTASQINSASWFLFALACVGVLLLGVRAKRTPQLAQLGFLIVLAFLIVNKVYSPQYVLWLLPLAVMARPRWRDLLIWQAGEAVYFAAVWLYLGGWLGDAGDDGATAYSVAILTRIAAQLYFAVRVIGDIRSVDDDPVDVGRGEPAPHADLVAH